MSEGCAFGVVVIGRNEGERLLRCLRSLQVLACPVVYVDSASRDGSFDEARRLGAQAVQLDLTRPFTAARARNFGFDALQAASPDLRYVQFVDGDCEVARTWIPAAMAYLDAHPAVAVVCGRRRERFPEASVYNQLCDIEWDTPVGEAKACGGDAMMRVEAFRQTGGFREDLIAGEEPELCVRLRAAGWRIFRLDEEMTLHDAAMTHFSQWWRRTTRAGYAFAEGAHLHGAPPERHWVRETRRSLLWGLAFPAVVALACVVLGAKGLALLLAYPAQILRIAFRAKGSTGDRLLRASAIVIGKFPEALGAMKFWLLHLRGRKGRLIEYK